MEEHENFTILQTTCEEVKKQKNQQPQSYHEYLILCFAFVLSALCGAIAAPLPNTESAGELITNTTESIAESYNTTSPTNSTPTQEPPAIAQSQLSASGFNCSASGEGPEFAVAAGYLLEGLFLLNDYSKIVQRSYRNFVSG